MSEIIAQIEVKQEKKKLKINKIIDSFIPLYLQFSVGGAISEVDRQHQQQQLMKYKTAFPRSLKAI